MYTAHTKTSGIAISKWIELLFMSHVKFQTESKNKNNFSLNIIKMDL